MKKYFISLILIISVLNLSAQVLTKKTNSRKIDESTKLETKYSIDVVSMPAFDVKKLIEEDSIDRSLNLPYRFGYAFEVDYNMQNSGTWIDVEGGKVWALKIVSKGAYSINLEYSKFRLPKNSQLYIYNEDKTVLQGPFTSGNNRKDGTFSSDLVEGSAIILEYFEPHSIKEKPRISISKIVHAYRNLFPNSAKGYGNSGNCNIDINCPEGNAWQEESNAVAMILVNGDRICSGCMVNNTAQDFTPYFLTANHCVDGQNVNNWTFRFQYKSPTCGGGDDYSYYSYSGSTLRARSAVSDFALLELDTIPQGETGITYAGWSRSATAPNSAVGIHHPKGDVMKISFDNDTLIRTNYPSLSGNNHWRVIYDRGTAEHGSSGSPIFDHNQKVIGQLHGGYPGCSSNRNFWYGSFDVSWNNGLAQFLDPDTTGAITTNTVRIPYISGTSNICAQATYNIDNLPDVAIVTWNTSNNNLQLVSGQGTSSAEFQKNGNGSCTINAEITIGTQEINLSKEVWVGTPVFELEGSTNLYPKEPGFARIIYLNSETFNEQGVSSVEWSYSGPLDYLYGGNYYAKYRAGKPHQTEYGIIEATINNACGNNSNKLLFSIEGFDPHFEFFMYPNPVNNIVTLKIIPPTVKGAPKMRMIQNKINYEIQIWSERLGLVKKLKSGNLKQQIKTNHLPNGIYFIKILQGGKVVHQQQLKVKH